MHPTKKEDVLRRCSFYSEKRKRNCQVQVSKGFQYCAEHAFRNNEPMTKPRIPCPFDPKHTVFVHKLKKHLRICNSRPKDKPTYYVEGININKEEKQYTGKKDLASFTPEEILDIIRKLRKVQQAHLLDFKESIHSHDVLKTELGLETNGPSARKHLDQLSSILGNMDDVSLLAPNMCYIEYGAGKGRLSQWIFDAVAEYSDTHFILVDKKNVRHKRDLHHKEVRQNLSMERLIIDIQDLDLTKVAMVKDNPSKHIVAYCKHLCGAATDLALRSVFPRHADSKLVVKGVAMATCCHHCCSWDSYVGRCFLAGHGFDRSEFEALIRLSSWSICGSRNKGTMAADSHSHGHPEINGERETLTSALGLTIPEREEIGQLAKNLLDIGRVDFLRKNGMMGSAVQYVKREVTLENTLLIATGVNRD